MIVHGMFVCSSFLISVCMFIVLKALLISSATVIVRAWGSNCLNPLATVLLILVCVAPSLWSVVFCARVAWVCLLLCKEEGTSPVSLQLLRGGTWACMRCPCLLGFWIGTMLANFHV